MMGWDYDDQQEEKDQLNRGLHVHEAWKSPATTFQRT